MKKLLFTILISTTLLVTSCGAGSGSPDNTNSSQASSSEASSNPASGDSTTDANTDTAGPQSESIPETDPAYAALDFSFTSTDIFDAPVSSEIYSKADLTLVNIFTTWCPPCIQEMPYLAKIHTEYADKGFQIVGFCVDTRDYTDATLSDEAINAAKDIYESSGITYPFVIPDETFMNGILFVQSVPTSVFLDKNGKMVGNPILGSNDYEGWKKDIDAHLNLVK